MLSRRGVCNDLKTSPFIYNVLYDNDTIDFIFSSKTNMNKFEERKLDNRVNISRSLTGRFKLNISMDILADIVLYQKIEHRGFLIKLNNEEVLWPSIIKLDGQIRMLKN